MVLKGEIILQNGQNVYRPKERDTAMLPGDSLSPLVAGQELPGPVLDLQSGAPVEKNSRVSSLLFFLLS